MLIGLWNGIHIPDISLGLHRECCPSHQAVNSVLVEQCWGTQEQPVVGCEQQMLSKALVPRTNRVPFDSPGTRNDCVKKTVKPQKYFIAMQATRPHISHLWLELQMQHIRRNLFQPSKLLIVMRYMYYIPVIPTHS